MTTTYKKDPLQGTVKDIKPVDIQMVRHSSLEPLWDELVRKHHYLGHRKMPGANLKYLAFCGGSPVAALSFRAASLKLGPRDCFIGWSVQQRSQHLVQLANNNRFLILPWVNVKNLGSYCYPGLRVSSTGTGSITMASSCCCWKHLSTPAFIKERFTKQPAGSTWAAP